MRAGNYVHDDEEICQAPECGHHLTQPPLVLVTYIGHITTPSSNCSPSTVGNVLSLLPNLFVPLVDNWTTSKETLFLWDCTCMAAPNGT